MHFETQENCAQNQMDKKAIKTEQNGDNEASDDGRNTPANL